MSFYLRHPTAKLRRGSSSWSFWLWSAGAWVVIASTVFRSDARAPGPGLAAWGPGTSLGDALIASPNQASGPSVVSFMAQPVALAEPMPDQARSAAEARTLGERSSRWRALTSSLRQFIDRAAGKAQGWGRLVIDDSGEASGSAADLAFRSQEGGPGVPARQPHFVIGNGSRSNDGRIDPTGRALEEEALRITLIGDLRTRPPTPAQLHALTELIDYLRAKTGMIPVQSGSRAVEKTAAPGTLPQGVLDLAFNQTLTQPVPFPARPEAK